MQNLTSSLERRRLHVERIMLRRPGNQALLVASIKGSVNLCSLRNALSVVKQKYILCWARVAIENDGSAWFVWDDNTEPVIQEVNRTGDGHWLEVMSREHRVHINPIAGPLARFTLVRGESRSELIVNCHHAICDGLSLSFLLRDLLLVMSKCVDAISPLPLGPVVKNSTVRADTRRSRLSNGLIHLVNWLWRRGSFSPKEEDFNRLDAVYWEDKNPRILAWTLDELDLDSLVAKCRYEGITVNSALCAALLHAQYCVQGDKSEYLSHVHIPVNIRDELKEDVGEALGFYAAPVIVRELNPNSYSSFWNWARSIHDRIAEHLNYYEILNLLRINYVDPTLVDSLYLAKYNLIESRLANLVIRFMGISNTIAGFAITNLGRLSIPSSYGHLKLLGIHGPSVFSDLLEKVFGIATVNGTMCMTATFDDVRLNPRDVEAIQSQALHLLETECV